MQFTIDSHQSSSPTPLRGTSTPSCKLSVITPMDRLRRSLTQNSLGFVLRNRLVMYFRDVNFFVHETDFRKNAAGVIFFDVELKLRKYCVLHLKTRQQMILFGVFPGRVAGRSRSTWWPAPNTDSISSHGVIILCIWTKVSHHSLVEASKMPLYLLQPLSPWVTEIHMLWAGLRGGVCKPS